MCCDYSHFSCVMFFSVFVGSVNLPKVPYSIDPVSQLEYSVCTVQVLFRCVSVCHRRASQTACFLSMLPLLRVLLTHSSVCLSVSSSFLLPLGSHAFAHARCIAAAFCMAAMEVCEETLMDIVIKVKNGVPMLENISALIHCLALSNHISQIRLASD